MTLAHETLVMNFFPNLFGLLDLNYKINTWYLLMINTIKKITFDDVFSIHDV